MKEPESDPVQSNRVRLSSTQADGDSFAALRDPTVNADRDGRDEKDRDEKGGDGRAGREGREDRHGSQRDPSSRGLGGPDAPDGPGPGPVPPPAGPPPVEDAWPGPVVRADPSPPPPSLLHKAARLGCRFAAAVRRILLHSWLNFLLVFVPAGIAVGCVPAATPAVVFSLNAIAIVPLAGLLAYATESVARRMGDSIGALLNITFGNAVELIIFIIALVKNEIRIVQASLLGSILANLLLILGMGFLLGGLRFREQIYNSTVTQMSACLLSLSVISLVLPTAFHASFNNTDTADQESLKISRGTSVVLLLVYGLYLLFQLKSHAYLYESTPQYLIDEEASPGPAAAWLDSSDSDSASSSSDSDSSGHSRDTVKKRVRRVIHARRRRKSSLASQDTAEGVFGESRDEVSRPSVEDDDDDTSRHRRKHRHRRHHKHKPSTHVEPVDATEIIPRVPGTRHVDFAFSETQHPADAQDTPARSERARLAFNLRALSLRPVAKSLAPTVFMQAADGATAPPASSGPIPHIRYGIRRTNSLPDRLNRAQLRAPGSLPPAHLPASHDKLDHQDQADQDTGTDGQLLLSRRAAVLLLLITTGLVAACAEFMVDSITGLTETSSVSQVFIGLIILPIVGNAAEHVTAVTVAMKNKMDLAIGVAVGSSIQIALFTTPLVVILGWAMDREMTLYFTLFETVSLFVSAFIVNFLVLDGRSNYLEGALLCATYVIIGLVAFYYPETAEMNDLG